MTYAEKLKDPRWQKKRLELLDSREWKCLLCGEESKTLHVHHTYYARDKMPWEYEDWAYQVLCKDCHEIAKCKMETAHKILAIHPHLISSIYVGAQYYEEYLAVALLNASNAFQESFSAGFDKAVAVYKNNEVASI